MTARIAAYDLALAMAVSSLLVPAMGAMGPTLRVDLALTPTAFGLLATVFLATAAVSSMLLGPYAALLGSRTGLLLLFAFVAFGYVWIAVAPDLPWLLAGMALAGVANAVANPLTNEAIRDLAPVGARGALVGLKQSGVQIGSIVTGAMLPVIAEHWSWRAAVACITVLPLAGLVLTRLVIPHGGGAARRADRPRGGMRTAVLQGHPFVAWLAAASCFMGACLAACPIFLPLFAFDELGFSATTSGLCVALTGLMGVFARVTWGRVAEQRGHRILWDLGLIAAGSAVAVLLVMVAPRVGSWSLWLGVLVFGGVASGWNVIAAVTTIRDLPAALGSAGTSLIQTAFFIGLMAGPLLFATVLEESGGYQWAWLTIVGTCALAAATMLAWGGGRQMAAIT